MTKANGINTVNSHTNVMFATVIHSAKIGYSKFSSVMLVLLLALFISGMILAAYRKPSDSVSYINEIDGGEKTIGAKVESSEAVHSSESLTSDSNITFDESRKNFTGAVPATGVALEFHEKTFYKGYTFIMSATISPPNATDKISWSSGSEEIVSINQSGRIVCLRAGAANITATAGKMYDVCKITVKANPVWLDESDAVKVLPRGASFDQSDGTLVWVNLNDAFREHKIILKNEDLYGYHIVGFYGYEECDEFKNGWKARIKDSSMVEVLFDKNNREVNGELGIIIISNGAGYMPGADTEKHITVKFSGKNESSDTTGCSSFVFGFLVFALMSGVSLCCYTLSKLT